MHEIFMVPLKREITNDLVRQTVCFEFYGRNIFEFNTPRSFIHLKREKRKRETERERKKKEKKRQGASPILLGVNWRLLSIAYNFSTLLQRLDYFSTHWKLLAERFSPRYFLSLRDIAAREIIQAPV